MASFFRASTPIEKLVKDATTMQDSYSIPPANLMEQLADQTRSFDAFPTIFRILWKRINDDGRKWQHINKSLTLLEYLLIHGSEQCITEAKVHIAEVKTLTDFYHHERGIEVGAPIREKAHRVVALLNDDLELQRIRAESRR